MATILITANWGTVMMAFLNKAAHRVQQGQLPISEGDEDLLQTKTVVASTETKVMSPEKENP